MGEANPTNVVEVGDFSFERRRRGLFSDAKGCTHKRTTIEAEGEIVRCRDCNTQVSAFWVLTQVLDALHREKRGIAAERERLAKEQATVLPRIAARELERSWRSKSMVPTCPHCGEGVAPDDGFGRSMVHVEIDRVRRLARGAKKR